MDIILKLESPYNSSSAWNKTNRSYTQLDSRKQAIAFQDRVITIHKGSSTPTKMRKMNSGQIQYNVENFDKIHALRASVRNWSSQ